MQVLLAAWLAAVVALGAPAPAAGDRTVMSDHPRTLHVAAHTAAPGDGSMTSPYPHITQALAVAVAGDTVLVGPGRYAEELRSVRPGRPGAPIRIVGRPGTHLVGPRGRGRGRLIQVLHDHVTLQSLELSDANILVWVEGAKGVRLLRSRLHDAGGECMRLKGVATANEVAGNVIARCGRVRFNLARGSKNGEAIYIGTAPEQSGGRPDRSDGNRVHHNRIAATAECVDVKEAARGTWSSATAARGAATPTAPSSPRVATTPPSGRTSPPGTPAPASAFVGTAGPRGCATTWSATPSPTTRATVSRCCGTPRAGSRATPSPATVAGARTRGRSHSGGAPPSFLTTPFSRRRARDPLVSNRVVRTPHVLQLFYPLSG
jgi:hypothetical protein